MTDTKIKTLSREFRIYDGEDTGLAPLAVIQVPDTVGESDGAATEHLFNVTDTLGIDMFTLTAVLFKTVAPTPDQSWKDLAESLKNLGVPYRKLGVAIWEEKRSSGEAAPQYTLENIYSVAKWKIAQVSYEERLTSFKEAIDYHTLAYSGKRMTEIYELNCGEL